MLHTHVYGPTGPEVPTVLAIHGVTGYGGRWRALAEEELAGVRVLAPDLRGHARSPWEPPWSLEQLVADLVEVLEYSGVHGSAPAVVIGHSLGGAVACRLAQARPDLVRGLLLLDPAQGLDPGLCLATAEQTIRFFDFTSPDEARRDKKNDAWECVPDQILDTEIADHLVRRDSGRWEWNISCAAVTALWGELARDPVGPPAQTPSIVLRARRANFVTAALLAALPATAEVIEVDSDHMVPQEVPQIVGLHARGLIEG